MTFRLWLPLIGLAGLAAGVSAQAQTPVPKTLAPKVEIPRGLRPPAGMCRIWVDNVPARQQPAPTDCASAIRNRPPNGRVIFPEDKDGKGEPKTDRRGKSEKSSDAKPKKPGGPPST